MEGGGATQRLEPTADKGWKANKTVSREKVGRPTQRPPPPGKGRPTTHWRKGVKANRRSTTPGKGGKLANNMVEKRWEAFQHKRLLK